MESNKELVDHLIQRGVLKSQNIIEAFIYIDRADFVPYAFFPQRYGDYPLYIGNDQTISQPTTVAMMLEMLSPKKGDTILDIGSGSGWTTALLSYIVGQSGRVTGLERIDELIEFGSANLSKYHFHNTKIQKANNTLGIKDKKFDRILVSAAAKDFPKELVEQLNIGGKLVIPVQNSIYEVLKMDDDIKIKKHYGFSFVPLIY